MQQAKWTLAVDRWIDDNDCDASAIQCWRSLQDNFGCATCLTMSMMGEKLTPSACEVDVMGAVSMYALALAAHAPSAILDWNNNYGHEADKCVCTHCGNYPKSFIGSTPEISELDVLGSVLGKEKCFGAVKGKVKAGPMTYFRASTDDRLGVVKTYVGEGEFTDDPFAMDGGIAVTKVARLQASARLRRPQRLRTPRGDGARSLRRRRSPRRPAAISAGRPIVTRPSPTATPSLRRFSGREHDDDARFEADESGARRGRREDSRQGARHSHARAQHGLRGAARPSRRRSVGRPTSWRRSISA